ncbi:hypothetical protein H7F16_13445 [Gemmobacter straminiformis]|uniref:Type II toxin-antitoxin system PemK/MazF family toxin n=1 Tax=Paragemmobacter straminiformis TaxID=2045119 RepID=A0A842IC06_9RHOB|nr:hypothetical protein [Gemmobacter straminiformis]
MTNHSATRLQDTNADDFAIGDVLHYPFPSKTTGGETDTARPCLVIDTHKISDRAYLLIADGAPAEAARRTGYDILVEEDALLASAGLEQPTRFCAARRVFVSRQSLRRKAIRPDGGIRVGRLTGRAFERLNAVRGRLHAEADIARHQREEERR